MVQTTLYPFYSHPESQHLPYTMNISESPEIIQHVGIILLGDILQLVIVTLLFGLL